MVAVVRFDHGEGGTPAAAWRPEIDERAWPPVDLGGLRRVVVVAAHPDDETLGAGGLVAHAHRLGLEVDVVVATRGEACHPRSPTHTPRQLAALRVDELDAAVAVLSPGTRPAVLGLPDGAVAEHEEDLVDRLVTRVGDGRGTLVVATWRGDGHPDHEAVGRAAAVTAARTGARLLEYPVWFWHWGTPGDAPWEAGQRLDLDETTRQTKRSAVAAHRTQVRPLSPAPGDEVLLTPGFLEHFEAPYEVFWGLPAGDDALDALHRGDEDPWGVDTRWYERRKRDLLLAVLPRRRFRRAVEVGCSTGALAEALADRCDSLVAMDSSPVAVAAATQRLAGHDHVEVLHGSVPGDWHRAGAGHDLVVLSEVGYFLCPAALEELGRHIRDGLPADGVVVLCHWRHEISGWPLDGPDVHARLAGSGLPPVVAEYRDRDVEILVLTGVDQLPDPDA